MRMFEHRRRLIAYLGVATILGSAQAEQNDTVIKESNIYFVVDSVKLDQQEKITIDDLAKQAVTLAASRIELTGHADEVGSEEYNLDISRRRAEAVANRLIQRGVSSNTVQLDWKGEFMPAVPSGGAERQNRRVTVRVIQ